MIDIRKNLPGKTEAEELVDSANHKVTLWGGLGDVINHLYWHSCYKDLEIIPEGRKALVVVSCHNPHASELLLWHPNLERMTILDIEFRHELSKEEWRKSVGLGQLECSHRGGGRGPVPFYPSPNDLSILEACRKKASRFVAISPTAGTPERYIPDPLLHSIERLTIEAGFIPAFIGRSYHHRSLHGGNRYTVSKHPILNGSMDFTNLLTVPGTAELLKMCAASVCTHSSMALLSWHLKKKTFLIYNDFVAKNYIPLGPGGYLFGLPLPGNDGVEFPDFTKERYLSFLSGIKP